MADVAVEGTTEGVWHNLFLEVDKVASYKHPCCHIKLILILDPYYSTLCCIVYIQSSILDPALHNM